ncbi:MAG: hypothetical protein WAX69_22355, partial [Victivallales bacterium]
MPAKVPAYHLTGPPATCWQIFFSFNFSTDAARGGGVPSYRTASTLAGRFSSRSTSPPMPPGVAAYHLTGPPAPLLADFFSFH